MTTLGRLKFIDLGPNLGWDALATRREKADIAEATTPPAASRASRDALRIINNSSVELKIAQTRCKNHLCIERQVAEKIRPEP